MAMRIYNWPEQSAECGALLFDTQRPSEEKARAAVLEIIRAVRARGDAALREYTQKFDGVAVGDFRVSEAEFAEAYEKCPPELLTTIRACAASIRAYHEKQKRETWLSVSEGKTVGQLVHPLDSVGVYVPGGRAPYPSTVLMAALPAQVAGVKEIALATPPGKDGRITPAILVAAREAGVSRVYKVGGAQAIAALCYGTETIESVAKICGPGNLYVTLAKKEVYGDCGIDMLAGPSEILIIADRSANPRFAAADLLSQAEHDPLARSILLTTDAALAEAVASEVEAQLKALSRESIARESIESRGAILIVNSLDEAFELSARVAPEHLELCIEAPFEALGKVRNAGSCFIGHYAPEPLGDYYAGPNHTLPTSGTARFSSALSVDDFVRKTSVIYYGREALSAARADIERLANAEGLTAHARAVSTRFEQNYK